jgi:protein involved in polysaccharide export with SLBB domain
MIPPVGRQIAIAGSVNEEAIYEAKAGETLGRLIDRFAGGTTSLADATRIMLYRVDQLDKQGGQELSMTEASATLVEAGDIVQVLSVGTLARPLEKQAVLVRIDGEVAKPGDYYVRPNSSIGEVMGLAGGLTPRAYVYGTKFQRFSVRQQQRESFAEAIQQLELALLSAPLSGDDIQNPAVREGQRTAAREVLERLRKTEPDGRVILQIDHDTPSLPSEMTLENNDHIYVPPRPTTVGVFGSVYRPGSFQIASGLKVKDLVDMAGGPVRAADRGAIFVVRANGEVVPKRRGALDEHVLPGDLVFVPIKSQYSSVWSKIRDISSIIFQLGLGAAAFVAVAQ